MFALFTKIDLDVQLRTIVFYSVEASTCMMSEWISWSPCSASCGMGMRSRERYVKQFPEDGSSCTLPTEETEKCVVNDECCKLHMMKLLV